MTPSPKAWQALFRLAMQLGGDDDRGNARAMAKCNLSDSHCSASDNEHTGRCEPVYPDTIMVGRERDG